jgi:hypothetical protein
LFVGPEFRLLCLDTGTIQLRDPLLPFFNQPGRLAAAALGTRKHPFGMHAVELRYLKRDRSPVIETLV